MTHMMITTDNVNTIQDSMITVKIFYRLTRLPCLSHATIKCIFHIYDCLTPLQGFIDYPAELIKTYGAVSG